MSVQRTIKARRSPPTLGAARKELDFETMRQIGKYADFFSLMCELHPELIKDHFLGAFAKSRIEEVEAGVREGMNYEQWIKWLAEAAGEIALRIAGPTG